MRDISGTFEEIKGSFESRSHREFKFTRDGNILFAHGPWFPDFVHKHVGYNFFTIKGNPVGSTYFAQLPGCCGVVVSFHTYLEPGFRHSEYSDLFRGFKEAIARHYNFTIMLATSRYDDLRSLRNFEKSNYNRLLKFKNKRSFNDVVLGVKEI